MNSRDLVLAVIEAIAYAHGRPPEELGYNLHEYIDLDVFYTLAHGMDTAWEFSFELPDYTVRVTSDELIFVDGIRFEVDDTTIAKNRTWTEEYR